jgi:hypothetical protein
VQTYIKNWNYKPTGINIEKKSSRRPTLINNPNTRENQNHGYTLFPVQMV